MVDEKALRMAGVVANRVARNHRGYVEADDIRSECFVWLVKKQDKVAQWVDEGKPGLGKLNKALYRHAFNYARRERAKKSGTQVGDNTYYTPGLIEDLLPDVYEYDAWTMQSVVRDNSSGRRPAAPNEGNTLLAMLVDVKQAVASLPLDEQVILRNRYADGGMDLEFMATLSGITERAMRDRIDKLLVKVADRLGGTPPWWEGRRHARSNASAQAETRGE